MNTPHSSKNRIQQDPREPAFVQSPYGLYKKLHALGGPVYWENYAFWCLSSFEAVNQTLRDRRFARLPPPGCKRPAPGAHLSDFSAAEQFSLLAMEPPEHTRLRKIVNSAFVSRRVGSMADAITTLANQCIDSIEANGQTELLATFATPIPVAVITRLLGVPESAGQQLVDWSHAIVKVYTMTQTHEDEVAANAAARDFRQFIISIIEQKRNHPDSDLISHLLTMQHTAECITEEEIVSIVILLLNAGHEATVHQLGNAVRTLLTHYPPGKRQTLLDLLADDESADAVVAECLRYDAPLHLFMRYAQERVELDGGLVLEPGEQIGLLLAAANRCPQRFTQADSFVPDRSDGANLSLGAGLHFCVGAHLAKLELRIALQVLFGRLPDLTMSKPLTYQDTYHFHGLSSLPVRW